MSLLLDALKKAELAKQAAAAREAAHADTTGVGQSPLMTRDRLPDLAGLELVHDDLAPPPSKGSAPTRPIPTFESAPSLQVPQQPAAAGAKPEVRRSMTRPAEEVAADRLAARQVFEAKQTEYNPRRAYYATLGLLGLLGVGIAGYFWWQLQPRSNFVTTTATPSASGRPALTVPPTPSAPETPPQAAGTAASPVTQPAAAAIAEPPKAASAETAAAAPAPVPRAAAAPIGTTSPDSAARAPASGGAATRSPAASLPSPPQPKASAPTARARPTPAAAAADAASAERRAPVAIVPTRRLDRELETAYGDFEAGNLGAAREAYQQVLRADPTNRDAILGLAAIEVRAGDANRAESRYEKLLERDPRDPHAQAALAALRPSADPVQSESRIKTLISQQPDSAPLQFALGNLLSGQSRWNEAQAAYFKAFSADPENADFAYNLAVSLDHLRQPRLALEYYQRALALSAQRPASFDRGRAATRARELER